jgi:hypothetical protein
MSKKTKTLIGAFSALVLLAGGYFGAQVWQKKKASSPSTGSSTPFVSESVRLTEFNSAELVKIEIRGSDLILEKEKSEGGWEVTSSGGRGININQSAVSDKLWSISSLWAERTIEENPADLSQYGLDNPQGHTIITDSAGKKAELFFGSLSPNRGSYYTQVAGDPKVYLVSTYSAASLLFTLDDLRDRSLLPSFDPTSLRRFTIERDGKVIDLTAKGEDANDFQISSFSSFILNYSSYTHPRGASSDNFSKIQEALGSLTIAEFVDDNPASLAPYGLDKGSRLYIEAPDAALDLRFGTGTDGRLYAKFADTPGVFIVSGLEAVVNTNAFSLADKFILIFHIDTVKDFTVVREGRTLKAEIRGTKDEPEFYLDGRKCADKEFRAYYQAVIGLLVDAEYPGPQNRTSEGPEVTVTFNMKEPAGAQATATFIPYNRDFYSVTQQGATDFLLSRSQVQTMFDTADKMVYEDAP